MNGTERAKLEKFGSNYDILRDRTWKEVSHTFSRGRDNDCEKKFGYGRDQNFEDAFEGGCLNSAEHEKLRMLRQTLDRF